MLLVTDSDDERDLYRSAMPLHGFRVSCVALQDVSWAVGEQRPDVLVLNMRLGADETWAQLEEMQCGGALNVPGVLLTGSVRADGANRLRARNNGCAAFVATPCSPAGLARILRSVISGARGLVVMQPERFQPADGQIPVRGTPESE